MSQLKSSFFLNILYGVRVFFPSKFTVIIRIGFKLTVLNSNFLGKDDAESMVSAVFSVSTLCGKQTKNKQSGGQSDFM